jgi:stearoyl-CoA desaturase (Delta-9 desaturase)
MVEIYTFSTINASLLASFHPRVPSRDELLAQAQAMFARTRSLNEIVDRAHQLLLGAVGTQLIAVRA